MIRIIRTLRRPGDDQNFYHILQRVRATSFTKLDDGKRVRYRQSTNVGVTYRSLIPAAPVPWVKT